MMKPFNSFNKVFACNDGVRHFSELGPWVSVDVDAGSRNIGHAHIMRVLALFAFFTNTCFEVRAEGRLIVYFTVFSSLDRCDSFEQRL
jgi:hypothetical protein